MAPSTVEMTTEIVRILSTLMPEALANSGLEPTAVMRVKLTSASTLLPKYSFPMFSIRRRGTSLDIRFAPFR